MTNPDRYLAAHDTAVSYGVVSENPMTEGMARVRDSIDYRHPYQLDDPALVKITRLRLLGDPGPYSFPFFDVSYCYGELADGTPVDVQLPQYQFPKKNVRGHILQMCKDAGRNGKAMGVFDALSILM